VQFFAVRLWLFFFSTALATLGLILTFGGVEARSDGPWLVLAGLFGMLGVTAWTIHLHTRPRPDETDEEPTEPTP
jgi:hypothetical protein